MWVSEAKLRRMQGLAEDEIAREMGHTRARVTRESYINPEVARQVDQGVVLRLVAGGKRGEG